MQNNLKIMGILRRTCIVCLGALIFQGFGTVTASGGGGKDPILIEKQDCGELEVELKKSQRLFNYTPTTELT